VKDIITTVLLQVRGSWRFRWYALALTWAVAVVGWAIVMLLPNVYEAHARVYIDTDSVLKPLLNGLTVNSDVTSRASMMARVIMGRPNLERVALETDLSRRASGPEQFARLVTRLSQTITVDVTSGNMYVLRYTDRDSLMAQRVVQRLLDAFVEDTLGVKRADSGSAQQFLQQQIKEYEARLREAENQLAEFKRKNVGFMPGQQGDYYTRLQTENAKLQELEQKARLATERRNEIAKQLSGEEPTFGLFTPSSDEAGKPAPDAQLAEYHRQLDELLLQYTDKHPRVIALRETIAQLEAQRAAAVQKTPKAHVAPALPKDRSDAAIMALDINPVYQNLRIEQSRAEVDLAELHQQISEELAIVNDLKGRVTTIPVVEAQLTQLNRDYEVTRTQYQALLQRLDSARLSEQADSSNEQVKFRIIEPPVRPVEPAGPQRFPLMTGVLLAALAAGAGLATALNQFKPVFLSRAMLATVTGLPVLGSVSFVSDKEKSPLVEREPLWAALAAVTLLVIYAAGLGYADSVGRLLRGLVG
jgi:polysaccharide chain length determinant protein (PEP-CTERM system associated)